MAASSNKLVELVKDGVREKSDILQNLLSRLSQKVQLRMTSLAAAGAPVDVPQSRELMVKLISTLIGLAASFGITYFCAKWLSNAMDPTRKERQIAHEKV